MSEESTPGTPRSPENPFEKIRWTGREEPFQNPVQFLTLPSEEGELLKLHPDYNDDLMQIRQLMAMNAFDSDPFGPKKKYNSEIERTALEKFGKMNLYNQKLESMPPEYLNRISDITTAVVLVYKEKCAHDNDEQRDNKAKRIGQLVAQLNIYLNTITNSEGKMRTITHDDNVIAGAVIRVRNDIVIREREQSIDHYYTAREMLKVLFTFSLADLKSAIAKIPEDRLKYFMHFCRVVQSDMIKNADDLFDRVGLDEEFLGHAIFASEFERELSAKIANEGEEILLFDFEFYNQLYWISEHVGTRLKEIEGS